MGAIPFKRPAAPAAPRPAAPPKPPVAAPRPPVAPPKPAAPPAPPAPAPMPKVGTAPKKGNVDVAGMFAGVKTAQLPRGGSNFVRPTYGVFRVDRIEADQSRKGEQFVAVKMTCLHLIEPDNSGIVAQHGKAPHFVGEQATHMMMRRQDSFLGQMKALIATAMACDPNEVDENDCIAVCSEEQPLAGTVLVVRARNTTTKKNTDFTVVDYENVLATPEEVAAILTPEELARFGYDGAAPTEGEQAPEELAAE